MADILNDDWARYRQAMATGQYFEAHEILETPWRETRSIRMHIAIWIAAGFVHWSRFEYRGTKILFDRVVNYPAASSLPIKDAIDKWADAATHRQPVLSPTNQQLDALIQWGLLEAPSTGP